jgi:glutamate/tyrosine decarboxylase-like PLP-dependent enzyme
MRDLLKDAASRAARYLHEINDRPVAPREEAVEALSALKIPFPDEPCDPALVLAQMDEIGSPATVATTGGRYFGYVIGGVLPISLAAGWLSTTWDQNGIFKKLSPAGVALEEAAEAWMLEALGLPQKSTVSFVTGATMANFACLMAARRKVLLDAGWDVAEKGLSGAPRIKVIMGEEAHPTVLKALSMLGMGRTGHTRVPVDGQGRFVLDELPKINGPSIVILQAGNVNTGAFDPVGEVCQKLAGSGAWVHVDGAFGLWALASSRFDQFTKGLELADSWATDGHKWLNVPYDSGMAVVKHADQLRLCTEVGAAYLPTSERFAPESSRKARGIEVWAALKALGRRGLREMIERNCDQAQRIAGVLSEAGYDILNEVVLNQVLVSFGDEESNLRVIRAIQEDGTCWAGETLWQGRSAMRLSLSSWATTDQDVDRSLETIIRLARQHA